MNDEHPEQEWLDRCVKIAEWLGENDKVFLTDFYHCNAEVDDDGNVTVQVPAYHRDSAAAFRAMNSLLGFRVLIADETRVYRMVDNGQHTVEIVFGNHEDPKKAITLAVCKAIDEGFEPFQSKAFYGGLT